jgi:5-hydroxyisourate hydrolase
VTTLSTHVLDTELGIPAAGVRVTLYHGDALLARAETGPDGRISDLAGGAAVNPGIYRLAFDVAGYFQAQSRAAPFLQQVSLEFRLDAEPHYHVPLLLTPYACTSYRGA